MTLSIQELEGIRARWRRSREPLGLVNPTTEGFGLGGLASHVEGAGVRFLVLPADPDLSLVNFDGDFWDWWVEPRPNPFEGASSTGWGNQSTPTAHASVRYQQRSGKWNWNSCIALYRHGALEFVLGDEGVSVWRGQDGEQHRGFSLTTIVGRVWVALDLYGQVIKRYAAIGGPWEINLAFMGTKGTLLGNVAAGWRDFDDWFHRDQPLCPDSGLHFRVEIDSWPDTDGQRSVAFELGGMIEDAWGIKDRRWLIHQGHAGAGEFDVSRYR